MAYELTNAEQLAAVQAALGITPVSFSALKGKIERGEDASILIVSDSTWDSTDEAAYLFFSWLAETNPYSTFIYKRWNDGTFDGDDGVYNSNVTIQTGTRGGTVTMFNTAVSGSAPYYLLGAKLDDAIGVATAPDVIIWNHGLNTASDSAIQRGGSHMESWEVLRQKYVGVPHVVALENPFRDNDDLAVTIEAIEAQAAKYGDIQIIDSYSAFIAAGKPADWYLDSVHPNATGTAVILGKIQEAYNRSPAFGRLSAARALLDTVTSDPQTLNGDFSAWASTLPDSWTSTGSPTVSKELTIVAGASPYSLKMVGTAAGARVQQAVTSTRFNALKAAGLATLAVRVFSPIGSPLTSARVALTTNGPSGAATVTSRGCARGGWTWIILPDVPIGSDVTSINVYLYCDTSAPVLPATETTVYYDRAILVTGGLPRDIA